jgi:hypothetical protein
VNEKAEAAVSSGDKPSFVLVLALVVLFSLLAGINYRAKGVADF